MIASRRLAALFGLVCTVFAAPPLWADETQPERRVALVIGNSHYQHAPELANPTADAHAISDSFRRLGLDVTEGYDLNERDMRALLVKFANSMAGAKGAVVFYAGHGVALDGVNYMLPIDIDLKSPADLDLNGVSVDLVLRQMRRDDRVNVIILDACRDNPFAAVLSGAAVRAAVSSRGLDPIQGDLARGALIAFATDPDKTAFDGAAGAHSPFTAALLHHIEDPATSIEVVMSKVRGEVFAATGSKQLPWVSTSIVGDFELNPAKPAPPPAPPREADATQATENLLWESAERSQSVDDYRSYLDAFPNGVFAPLAHRRIEAAAAPASPDAAERLLQLTPTDRAMTRKALNKAGGGDPLDDGVRAALRDWQTRHGYAASGFLDGPQLARLKDDAARPASPAQPVVAKAPALTAVRSVPRAPLVRPMAPPPPPVVAYAKPKSEPKSEPKPEPKPKRVARRVRPEPRVADAYDAPEQEPAPAPAPDYSGWTPALSHVGSPGGPSIGFGFHHGWSDRRLKRDIRQIATSPSGIPVYTFRYKWSEVCYIGAMAQDLLRLRPAAVSKVGAYYQVDYDGIDVPFQALDPARCGA
jgi:uncharacterized caspase-like protein